MKIINVHEREVQMAPDRVGVLIDALASPEDSLWPVLCWPRMKMDRALSVGAQGGHGPIRYYVEEYTPRRTVKFRFTGPKGFEGYHAYECLRLDANTTVLRHTLAMKARGIARLSWPMVFQPLHDALVEDSLATAEASLGVPPDVRTWSWRVRTLRRLLSRGTAGPQRIWRGRHASDDATGGE